MAEVQVHLDQPRRVLVLFVNAAIFYAVYVVVTGRWIPTSGGESVWLWMGLVLWVISLLASPWFVPPRDAFSTSIGAGVALAAMDLSSVALLRETLDTLRWAGIVLSVFTGACAILAMVLRDKDARSGFGEVCYRLSESLGRGEVLLTLPVLVSIAGFYQGDTVVTLFLLGLWVFFVVVRPVEVAVRTWLRVKALSRAAAEAPHVGTIQRVDDPNIVRVALSSPTDWRSGLYVAALAGEHQRYVIPLFTQTQEDEVVGTGLCHGQVEEPIPAAKTGLVYKYSGEDGDLRAKLVRDLSGTDRMAHLVGFVVEGSSISEVRFEVSMSADLEEGTVIFANLGGTLVYYQILGARTAEESFERNPWGKHIVSASQLGSYDAERGFLKYAWLPAMNAPVFRFAEEHDLDQPLSDGEFFMGLIPSAGLKLRVSLDDLVEYHAAILGVTGTGKTEMALDIIREALDRNTKVFCVDFTGEYRARLEDCTPTTIGLSIEEGSKLEELLFKVETGQYGAGPEKATLKEFVDEVGDQANEKIDGFLRPDGSGLAIFELAEVTNTKATLRTTELYLSAIIRWAREHRRARRVLIVLEEAHTIIPETAGSGFDYDTQWVVSRIGQIALQGRKFGVGLLIISQRTALVSKTILSQCNTHFTHALVDRTSLEYLANVYSQEHVQAIPNLRTLEFLAYGKAVRSERPMLVRREWDDAKKEASARLNVEMIDQAENGD